MFSLICSNENLGLYIWSLNPMHLAAMLDFGLISSEYLCSAGGKFCNHSIFLFVLGIRFVFDVALPLLWNSECNSVGVGIRLTKA
jgi:Sec-independent protein secretion pathway component TatC